ncbi:protein phosphatase 1 regulatory subunit 42 [Harpegnathos saltator]|uniref:Leucine-rich repeat-containing protein 67 n=1 Tax=Harpegnathos saltator TaxID=610380 RepID=E2BND4_HARSA|nr:protein phosphatase 1 regulatory subunit 42 [Harpegnathos saltator]EFN82713.1 Leucine-rich repeat-containing protein 67 [Harpegnathos saltator]
MVKLTTDVIERKCSQILTTKSLSKTMKKEELQKLTHLHMNDMFISSIGNLDVCKSLKVLYLQNNNISKMKNLHVACNLTHLYLQHNAIIKMENLESLENLQKLYLGHNNIVVVEGLENLRQLRELHIESQRMPPGESLCFEPRSALTLSMCLRILDISDNKMTSLGDLAGFHELNTLEAGHNLIASMDDLSATVSTLTSLKDLTLRDNPVVRSYRYRENLIANSTSLVNLDGKIVTDTCRSFLRRFKMEKHNRRTRRTTKTPLGDDITNSLNLPPAFKRSISRAIFQHPGPQLSVKITPGSMEINQLQVFPSWKSASGITSVRDNHVTPRPFWSNVSKNKETRLTRSLVNNKAIALPPL